MPFRFANNMKNSPPKTRRPHQQQQQLLLLLLLLLLPILMARSMWHSNCWNKWWTIVQRHDVVDNNCWYISWEYFFTHCEIHFQNFGYFINLCPYNLSLKCYDVFYMNVFSPNDSAAYYLHRCFPNKLKCLLQMAIDCLNDIWFGLSFIFSISQCGRKGFDIFWEIFKFSTITKVSVIPSHFLPSSIDSNTESSDFGG